jgi:hypothetical protein
MSGYAHIRSGLELEDAMIEGSLDTREDVKLLLDHLAEIAKPASGAPRALEVFAKLATPACEWLEGGLILELQGTARGTSIASYVAIAGDLRERLFRPIVFPVDFAEFAMTAVKQAFTIAPLVVSQQASSFLELRAPEPKRTAQARKGPIVQGVRAPEELAAAAHLPAIGAGASAPTPQVAAAASTPTPASAKRSNTIPVGTAPPGESGVLARPTAIPLPVVMPTSRHPTPPMGALPPPLRPRPAAPPPPIAPPPPLAVPAMSAPPVPALPVAAKPATAIGRIKRTQIALPLPDPEAFEEVPAARGKVKHPGAEPSEPPAPKRNTKRPKPGNSSAPPDSGWE